MDEKAWLMYCCVLPHMDKKNRIGYGEFLAKMKKPKASKNTIPNELIEKYQRIMEARK